MSFPPPKPEKPEDDGNPYAPPGLIEEEPYYDLRAMKAALDTAGPCLIFSLTAMLVVVIGVGFGVLRTNHAGLSVMVASLMNLFACSGLTRAQNPTLGGRLFLELFCLLPLPPAVAEALDHGRALSSFHPFFLLPALGLLIGLTLYFQARRLLKTARDLSEKEEVAY